MVSNSTIKQYSENNNVKAQRIQINMKNNRFQHCKSYKIFKIIRVTKAECLVAKLNITVFKAIIQFCRKSGCTSLIFGILDSYSIKNCATSLKRFQKPVSSLGPTLIWTRLFSPTELTSQQC